LIHSLQILRGIAALLVVAQHLRETIQNLFNHAGLPWRSFSQGYVGVDIFFVLSGVIIYTATRDAAGGFKSSVEFLIKRFFRVVPMAWAVTVLAYVMLDPPAINLVKALLFIPLQAANPPFYGYSVLDVIWSLTYELVFYMIFAGALMISARYRAWIASALIILMIVLVQLVSTGPFSLGAHTAPLITFASPVPKALFSLLGNPLFVEFITGIMLGALYWRYREQIEEKTAARLLIASIALAYVVIALATVEPHGQGLMHKGRAACAAVFAALLIEPEIRARVTRPVVKGLLWLGTISFSLYLIHLFVIRGVLTVAATLPIGPLAVHVLAVLLVVALSIASAGLIYTFVEKRFVDIGRIAAKRFVR
jgi:exopolysaccharide production protein ExoZ